MRTRTLSFPMVGATIALAGRGGGVPKPLAADFPKYLKGDGTWDTPAGGGGAPTTAEYLVKTADVGLSAERVVTDTVSVTVDWGTAGQAKIQREALTGDTTATQNSNATTTVQARGLRETSGPTTLTMGAVADGQSLVRVGTAIIGVTLTAYLLAFADDAVQFETDTSVTSEGPYT